MNVLDRILPDIVRLLGANPRLSQYEMAKALGVQQPQVSMAMRRHRVKRTCDGCGMPDVVANHRCESPKMRVSVNSRLGSLVLHTDAVTVSDVGVGVRPVMVQAGDAEVFLSREDAAQWSQILQRCQDTDALATALGGVGG